jgi:hypothetical protein
MNFRGQEAWRSVRGGEDTVLHSADNTYRLFHERIANDAVPRQPGLSTGCRTEGPHCECQAGKP